MPGERKPVTVIGNKTGTSQVGAISTAKIKSKEGPFGDKKNSRKSHSAEKKKGARIPSLSSMPFTLVRFCRLREKSKKAKGDPLE